MIDHGKKSILGVRIDAVDYDAAIERILAAAHARRPYAVSALAVHGVMTGVLERAHRHRLNRIDLVAPDGQPVRWALNLLHGTRLRDRVYGPTLMLRTCQVAAEERLPIFLYGGTQDLLDRLSEKLLSHFPHLKIAGTMPSRFRKVTAEEAVETSEAIRASGARITFVGLGCPRQEVWAFEMREALSMPLLAVGAAFSFHAGVLPQAPTWVQDHGLEWAYRLVQEPLRLWRRYVLLNPLYLSLVALQMIGLYKVDDAEDALPVRVGYG